MADRPLHRRGIHEGRSPAGQRKHGKNSPKHEDDQVDKPVRRGRSKKLYPELQQDRDTDGEIDEEEQDSGSEHVQVTDDEVSPKPKVRKRRDRSPVRPAPVEAPTDIPDTPAEDKQRSKLWYVILVVAVTFIAVGVYQLIIVDVDQQPVQPPAEETKIDYFELFKPKLNELRRNFPSQNERFWKVLSSPLRRILKTENPDYPAILLVGVPVNGSQTAKCFSRTLMEGVNSVYSTRAEFYINSNDLLKSSPAHTKLELDNNLKRVLSTGKGVILDHIETLPAEGALLLHGYCDGDNAPFKTSVIVLMFHTNKDFASLSDRTFEDYLTELWQDGLGPDEMPALRARVANSVIIIKPEADVIC